MSSPSHTSRPCTPPPTQPISLFTPPRQLSGKRKRNVCVREDDDDDLVKTQSKYARRPLFSYSCTPSKSDADLAPLEHSDARPATPLLPGLPVFEGARPRSSPMIRSPGMASMSKFTQLAHAEDDDDGLTPEDEVGALGLAGLGEALGTPPPSRVGGTSSLCPRTPNLSHSPSSSSATSSVSRSPCGDSSLALASSCPPTPSPVSRFAAARRWKSCAQRVSIDDSTDLTGKNSGYNEPPSPVRRVWGKELHLWHSPPPPKYESPAAAAARQGARPSIVTRRPSLQGLENGLWNTIRRTNETGDEDYVGLGLGLQLTF